MDVQHAHLRRQPDRVDVPGTRPSLALAPQLNPPITVASAAHTPPCGPARSRRRSDINLLRSLPLLQFLDDEAAQRLAEQASINAYRRGALMVEQGQTTLALYGVLDGSARATRQGENGRTLVVDVMQQGDCFDELGVIDGLPHRATVRAVRPCDILTLPVAIFSQCLAQSAPLRDAMQRALVGRLRKANQRITMLALNDVRGCVIQHLLDIAETHDGQRVVPGPLRRQGIADTIGASRERVSRVMIDLVRTGAIEMLPDGRARIAALVQA